MLRRRWITFRLMMWKKTQGDLSDWRSNLIHQGNQWIFIGGTDAWSYETQCFDHLILPKNWLLKTWCWEDWRKRERTRGMNGWISFQGRRYMTNSGVVIRWEHQMLQLWVTEIPKDHDWAVNWTSLINRNRCFLEFTAFLWSSRILDLIQSDSSTFSSQLVHPEGFSSCTVGS